jgi:hypothetical protein
MLRARFGQTDVLASEAERGLNYSCPECGSALVLRKGWVRAHHFAHKVAGVCELQGQTHEHLAIKAALGTLLSASTSNYEVRAGGVMTDLYFASSNVAVKIQTSAITYEDWHRTTATLCEAGCIVIWVWGRYAIGSATPGGDERRVPAAVLKCHHEYFGRVYAFIEGHLAALHFDAAAPRETDYGIYYPKRLRTLRSHEITNSNLRLHVDHGGITASFRLLHLEDPWWKTKAAKGASRAPFDRPRF